MIDLLCCSCDDLLQRLERAGTVVDFMHADPPWSYSKAAPPGHGRATEHYGGLPVDEIAATIHRSAQVAAADCYGVVWCTMPLLEPWVAGHAQHRAAQRAAGLGRGWEWLTGGSWGKTDARRGIGHHLLGDVEPALVYRRGQPHPQPPGPISNDWRAPRRAHSAKPVEVLASLLRWATPPGGLVLDLYAGASASMARACLLTGRRYIGAELDPHRHAAAMGILETVR